MTEGISPATTAIRPGYNGAQPPSWKLHRRVRNLCYWFLNKMYILIKCLATSIRDSLIQKID